MRLTPAERRLVAINAVVNGNINPEGILESWATRASVIAQIEQLRPFGRTQRWGDQVSRWRNLVEDEENDLHWAIVQGALFAGHAAL